jgi:hypothetical protein
VCTFALAFYGYKLQKKMNTKTQDYFFTDAQPLLKIKEF